MIINVKYRLVGLEFVLLLTTLFPVIKITGNKITIEYTPLKAKCVGGPNPQTTITI